MKLRLVEVEWVDSCRLGGWNDESVYRKNSEISYCKTYGLLLESSKKQVTVVQSVNNHGGMTDSMSIPRSAVRKITTCIPKEG